MSGFLYYIPKVTFVKDLAELGLAYAAAPTGLECRMTTNGPDGGPGVVAVPQGPGKPRSNFDPDAQAWRTGPDGRWWVGYERASRPTPADLRRPQLHAGGAVVLRDRNEWVVPRCTGYLADRPPTLPMQLDLAEDGQTWVGAEAAEYRKLCEGAVHLWKVRYGLPENDNTQAELYDLCSDALAVNYRIHKVEIALLGLMTDQEAEVIMKVMLDADEIDRRAEAAKKNGLISVPE